MDSRLDVLLAGVPTTFQFGLDCSIGAFDHLPAMERAGDFRLNAWTSEVQGSTENRYFTSGPFRILAEPTRMSSFNEQTRQAYFMAAPGSLSESEKATPFRTLFHWWAQGEQKQLAHAAAVGRPDGGILLIGRGGSGKSTTALACLLEGLSYVGDDYCLVGDHQGAPYAWSLYGTGKIDDRGLEKLSGLKPYIQGRDSQTGKSILHLKDLGPQLVPGFPVKAIVAPKLSDSCVLNPSTPGAALLDLAPSTIFQMPLEGPRTFQALAKFSSRLPCYTLQVGPDPLEAVGVISRLLDQL